MTIFIDGDFPTGKQCKYHCSPTCHPAQVDYNEWHYGCLHKAWPANRVGDFCPIVKCDGDPAKCEIPLRLLSIMRRSQTQRGNNLHKKVKALLKERQELDELIKLRSAPSEAMKEAGK